MSKKKKHHIPLLPEKLDEYANTHLLDYQRYSEYHMRLMDGGYTVLDIWTTGRYYLLTTDYQDMQGNNNTPERPGEKGNVPDIDSLWPWLDKIFFPEGE